MAHSGRTAGGGQVGVSGWCLRLVSHVGVSGWCLRLVSQVGVSGWCLRLVSQVGVSGWCLRLVSLSSTMDTHTTYNITHTKKNFSRRHQLRSPSSITNDHSTMHTTIDNDTLGGSVNAPHTCTHQSPLYIYIYVYFSYPRYHHPSSSTINHHHRYTHHHRSTPSIITHNVHRH